MTEERSPSLSEVELQGLCDRIAETEGAFLRGFRIATQEQHSYLESKLKGLQNVLALYDLIASLRKALTEEGEKLRTWIPKGHIVQVVRACCDQRYEEHDIESIFYKHGDINGLLVLHLGTQHQTRLFPKIYALSTDMIADLAEQCGKEEIKSIYIPAWIKSYDKSKTELDPAKGLPRLYRWGKEKEIRLSSPSVPRKRVRSGAASAKLQTGSDMQIKPTGVDAQQIIPPRENIPLRFDFQSSTRGLSPLQQHSLTLSDTAPHFGATLPVKPVSGAAQTPPVSNSEFMGDDSWAWTEVGMDYYFPRM